MKKTIIGGAALVAVLVTAVVTATAVQSKPRHGSKDQAATTSVLPRHKTKATTTTQGPAPSSTTTMRPAPVDPMAGVTMLGIQGRRITALDPQGNEMRTLVTAYAGRLVTGAHLMSNHHTIWYTTAPDYTLPSDASASNCSDVVRLDLGTDRRTVIAHADGFTVTPDGRRVVLSHVRADETCHAASWPYGINVVRDVSTGAQSTINGDVRDFAISPNGHVLVASHCTVNDGCRIPLQSASLPETLGAPVSLHPVNNPKLSFLRLVSGSDGLYGIVDTHAQGCGCEDRTDRFDRDVSVQRFSWDNLNGAGTEMFTVQGPLYLDNLVPSSAGLYAAGEKKVGAARALFRLDASGAHTVRTVPRNPYFSIAPISPAS